MSKEREELADRLKRVETLAGPILGTVMLDYDLMRLDDDDMNKAASQAVRLALATVDQIETMRRDALKEIGKAERLKLAMSDPGNVYKSYGEDR